MHAIEDIRYVYINILAGFILVYIASSYDRHQQLIVKCYCLFYELREAAIRRHFLL